MYIIDTRITTGDKASLSMAPGTSRTIFFGFRWVIRKAKAPKSYDLWGFDFT